MKLEVIGIAIVGQVALIMLANGTYLLRLVMNTTCNLGK